MIRIENANAEGETLACSFSRIILVNQEEFTPLHSTETTSRAIHSSDPLRVIRVVSLSSTICEKTSATPVYMLTHFVLILFSFLPPVLVLLFLLLLLAVRSRSPPPSLCPSSPCSLSSLPPSHHPPQHKRLVLSTPAVSHLLSSQPLLFRALLFDHLPTSAATHEHERQGDRHRGEFD